jgi:hypothetical protein
MINNAELNEHAHEAPVSDLAFEAYEGIFASSHTSSRKTGILSSGAYSDIMLDPTTTKISLDSGRMPVFVDAKYSDALGYDYEKMRKYAAADLDETIQILAIPVADINEHDRLLVIDALASIDQPTSIYFSDNGTDAAVLFDGLQARGIPYVEVPLSDYRCRPNNRQAALSLFVSDWVQDSEMDRLPMYTLSDVQAYFDTHTLPNLKDVENATLLKSGDSFTETQLDDIWELYEQRFQVLGENHPISMEDSKDDFLHLFTRPHTMVSVRYIDSKPVCFAYFTDNFRDLTWLNKPYLDNIQAQTDNLTPVFFPGIVASGAGGNYAEDTINLFVNHAANVGMNARVYFENTNLSEMYIPGIVFNSMIKEPVYEKTKPIKIDETFYRLFKLG